MPAHSLLECFEHGQRGARDSDITYVTLLEVHDRPIDMVHLERAADASVGPVRAEHEMLDDQLAAASKQIGKRLLADRCIENIGLADLDPGQRAPLGSQLIALPGEFLFLYQQ